MSKHFNADMDNAVASIIQASKPEARKATKPQSPPASALSEGISPFGCDASDNTEEKVSRVTGIRPILPPEKPEKRSCRLQLLLSPSLYKRLKKRIAKTPKLSANEYIFQAIQRALDDGI